MSATFVNGQRRPLLALWFALVISTVGFVTSVFSVVIFWLVPTWKPVAPQYVPKVSHGHVPHILAPPRRKDPPAMLLRKSNMTKLASPRLSLASVSSRRVSFDLAMSGISPSTRPKKAGPSSLHSDISEPSSSSAASSTSTLVISDSSSNKAESILESGDDSTLESDSSHLSSGSSLHRKSLSISAHLPSMKSVFLKRANRRSAPAGLFDLDRISLCDSPATDSGSETPKSWNPRSPTSVEAPKSVRRSMPVIGASWASIRQKYAASTSESDAPLPTPKSAKRFSLTGLRSPATPSSLFFKSDCQSPAPVPRTQPYGPPYYAATPDAGSAIRVRATRWGVDDDTSSLSSANSRWSRTPVPQSARLANESWAQARSIVDGS